MVSQDTPTNRLKPIAASVSRASVAPVKPSAPDSAVAETSPISPPGASGSSAARLWSLSRSSAALEASSRPNPRQRGARGGCRSIRRYPQTTT